MVRKTLIGAFVLFVLSGNALADEDAVERMQLATEVFELSQSAAMREAIVLSLTQEHATRFKELNPGASAFEVGILKGLIREEMGQSIDDYLNEFIVRYAQEFSIEELSYMRDFYESDMGRQILEKMPSVVGQGTEAGIAAMKARIPEVRRKLQARLLEQGFDL